MASGLEKKENKEIRTEGSERLRAISLGIQGFYLHKSGNFDIFKKNLKKVA